MNFLKTLIAIFLVTGTMLVAQAQKNPVEIKLDNKYGKIIKFKNNYYCARHTKKQKEALFNEKGKQLIGFQYDMIRYNEEGDNYIVYSKETGKLSLLNAKGKVVDGLKEMNEHKYMITFESTYQTAYTDVKDLEPIHLMKRNDNKMTFYNNSGEKLFDFKYDFLNGYNDDNQAVAFIDNAFTIIDRKGNETEKRFPISLKIYPFTNMFESYPPEVRGRTPAFVSFVVKDNKMNFPHPTKLAYSIYDFESKKLLLPYNDNLPWKKINDDLYFAKYDLGIYSIKAQKLFSELGVSGVIRKYQPIGGFEHLLRITTDNNISIYNTITDKFLFKNEINLKLGKAACKSAADPALKNLAIVTKTTPASKRPLYGFYDMKAGKFLVEPKYFWHFNANTVLCIKSLEQMNKRLVIVKGSTGNDMGLLHLGTNKLVIPLEFKKAQRVVLYDEQDVRLKKVIQGIRYLEDDKNRVVLISKREKHLMIEDVQSVKGKGDKIHIVTGSSNPVETIYNVKLEVVK